MVKMNEIHNRKPHNMEKSFPGCLGRMVDLFDLSTVAPGNRLLMDKPYHDGSTLPRSLSDVARLLSTPFGDPVDDKQMVPELRRTSSNKKASGTPMKMLIAQEMSKEVEAKQNTPNVVAKLMGLDALPMQQSHSAALRSQSKGYSRRSLSHSGIPLERWRQEDGFSDKGMQHEVDKRSQNDEYTDVYEIWKQSQQRNHSRDNSPQKGRYNQNINDKMALVRQKFMEAKSLATDEKLCQSKEIQDALEFLKFLQEPNSMLAQHLYEVQSVTPPPETKRITVLRPSKLVEGETFAGIGKKSDKQIKNLAQVGQATVWDKNISGYSPNFPSQKVDEYPPQPTRIVVLKPSPGKNYDVKAMVSPPPSSPRVLHDEDFYEEPEDDETRESREVAKKITRQMHENLMGHRRDETLLSSVLSNGYIGDESSFNKSENEYVVGNLSDTEVISPTSRHSWEYINRFGSPYSSSSFSRASCSPESSVCREAKKRLSERWAMMASNGSNVISQEQRHVQRSSSTLGEMLALSDTKKLLRSEEQGSGREQESRGSTSCLSDNMNTGGFVDSPKDLPRSKSVPVSSSVYDTNSKVEVSDPEACNTPASKEPIKAKSVKLSFKGKVSSLFFSRNKKPNKGKSSASQTIGESGTTTAATPGSSGYPPRIIDDATQHIDERGIEECLPFALRGSSNRSLPDFSNMGQKQGIVSRQAGLSVAKQAVPRHGTENQDQPSPISVLEPPFEEDCITNLESLSSIKLDKQSTEAPLHSIKSNLIDKSPPIGSIARTLSWDDSCTEKATSYPLEPSLVSTGIEEEQNLLLLVQKLLSVAGLNGEVQVDSFFGRWHSPDSPLDLTLREKYANMNEEPMHEAQRRQRRSLRKLVFDCVNAALIEITGYGSDRNLAGIHRKLSEDSSPILADLVWTQMKEWVSDDVGFVWGDSGDRDSLVVEMVVRQELVGKMWVEQMRSEVDNVGKEIEGKILEELVEDLMTGKV